MIRTCVLGQSVVAVNLPREEEVEAPVETAEVPAGEVPATAQAAPEAAEGEEKDKDKEAGAGKEKEAKKSDKKEKS